MDVRPTRQPLHPGGLVDAQVVDHDLHDAAQQLVEVLRGDLRAQLVLLLGEVLQPPLPPAGQVVAQHGQGDLDHVGHLRVAGPRLRQLPDVFKQEVQLGDVRTQLMDLTGETQDLREGENILRCGHTETETEGWTDGQGIRQRER